MADLVHQLAAPRQVQADENRQRAIQLRMSCVSYRTIAETLGISVGRAHQCVMEALAEMREQTHEAAAHVRDMELARLDVEWFHIEGKHDPRSLDSKLKIMERRAKLLGLDAPVESRVGGSLDAPPIMVMDARELLRQKLDDMERRQAAMPTPALTNGDAPHDDGAHTANGDAP
jgi:hypothetical protein